MGILCEITAQISEKKWKPFCREMDYTLHSVLSNQHRISQQKHYRHKHHRQESSNLKQSEKKENIKMNNHRMV